MGIKKISSVKNVKGVRAKLTLAFILQNKPPWARYSAASWSGTTLTDLTGNARHATTSGVALGSTTGNGVTGTITSIGGGPSTNITFPSGSIPTTFTVASLTRYTNASTYYRILQNNSKVTGNWFHGHHGSSRGTCYYDAYRTGGTVGTLQNWLNCVATNGTDVSTPYNILVDGATASTANGGNGGYTLAVNLGRTVEASDFELSQLIIWDQALSADELVVVAAAITTYTTTGILQ